MGESERTLLLLAILAAIAYYVLSKGGQLLGQATQPLSNAVADLWLQFTLPLPMGVLGNVTFPDGSQIPLSQLRPMQNPSTGAVAINFGGSIYQLAPSDMNGNWPATLVQ